jgi:hypothetical protein
LETLEGCTGKAMRALDFSDERMESIVRLPRFHVLASSASDEAMSNRGDCVGELVLRNEVLANDRKKFIGYHLTWTSQNQKVNHNRSGMSANRQASAFSSQ